MCHIITRAAVVARSKKILNVRLQHVWFPTARCWIELHKGAPQMLVDLHDCCLIATPVAIVWSRENRHHLLLVAPCVALHNQLVGPSNQQKAVTLDEFLRNVLSKGVPSTPRAYTPAKTIVRIAPKKVAHWSLMWNFLHTVESPHMIQVGDVWRKTAMLAKYFVLHKSSERKVVKKVSEALPYSLAVVFPGTLVVESIDLCNLPAFVVAPQHSYPLTVSNLEAKQQRYTFHGEVAAVYIVPEEEVICVWRKSPNAKELHQVMKLSMDITRNCNRASHRLHIALHREHLFRQIAELPQLQLG